MRATTVAVALLALLFCAGALALGGYGGFEVFRVTKATQTTQEQATKRESETDVGVETVRPRCDEGKLALTEKRFDAAIEALESCVAANPEQPDALFARGRAYAGIERFERAEIDVSSALAIDGANQEGWETLAWVRVRVGDDAGAVDAIDHWLALNPAAGEGYRSRADALYRLGRVDLAAHDARKACDLGVADGCVLEDRIRSVRR